MTTPIHFSDGVSYERYMGRWSQRVGEAFLDWLAPKPGLRWLDVGCGNGAFTELLAARVAPSELQGVDPSEGQLAHARSRPALSAARFQRGDAMALPFPDRSFEAVVMPLVITFVPDPAQGVAEMARVLAAGGTVSAYIWDMDGGGFPYAALHEEMRALGAAVGAPASPGASRSDVLQKLWADADFQAIEVRQITVQRTFADFADYWATVLGGPSVGPGLAAMAPEVVGKLQARVRARLPADAEGRITQAARANAIKGSVRRY